MTLRGVPEGDPATHRRKRYVDATGRTLALLGVLFVIGLHRLRALARPAAVGDDGRSSSSSSSPG